MRRMTRSFFMGLALLGSLGGAAVLAQSKPVRRPDVGHLPPEITGVLQSWVNAPVARAGAKGPLWDPEGKGEVDFERLKGKVVVVEFWATWCPPCRESIPHLNELQQDHPDDLVVLGFTSVDRQQSAAQIREFAGREIRYPVGILPDDAAMRRYGVEGIPHAFVIGKDGQIKWKGHPLGGDMAEAVHTELGPHERPASGPTSRPSRR